MAIRHRQLIARLNFLRIEIRSVVAACRSIDPPSMSDETAIKLMEAAALLGVHHNMLLFGKPPDDPDRIDSSFPF